MNNKKRIKARHKSDIQKNSIIENFFHKRILSVNYHDFLLMDALFKYAEVLPGNKENFLRLGNKIKKTIPKNYQPIGCALSNHTPLEAANNIWNTAHSLLKSSITHSSEISEIVDEVKRLIKEPSPIPEVCLTGSSTSTSTISSLESEDLISDDMIEEESSAPPVDAACSSTSLISTLNSDKTLRDVTGEEQK